jgi:serine protease Do
VLGQLIGTGHVARGWLGVAIQPVDASLGKALGTGGAKGALVAEVVPRGPADRAGIKAGDVISSLDGAPVPSSEDLPRMIARRAPGSDAKLEILRTGKRETIHVALEQLKEDAVRSEAAPAPGSMAPDGLGVEIGESPNRRGEIVVGRVAPGSVADGKLEAGDVILEVNRSAVHRPEEAAQRVKAAPAGEPILLKIRREGKVRFVAIDRRRAEGRAE